MTCRCRGVGLWEVSEADCLQDLGDAEFSREPIAVPCVSMAAVWESQVMVVMRIELKLWYRRAGKIV